MGGDSSVPAPSQAQIDAENELQQQQKQQQEKLKQNQLDFIQRLQGQASTTAGNTPSPSVTPAGATGSAANNIAPFGISGLFSGSNTIG
jgi:transcription initiation factor TFIID subunit TAF12